MSLFQYVYLFGRCFNLGYVADFQHYPLPVMRIQKWHLEDVSQCLRMFQNISLCFKIFEDVYKHFEDISKRVKTCLKFKEV